jgi:hypothetical protein
MLNEQHPPSLNEAMKAIQQFTKKYNLSVWGVKNFITILIEKAGGINVNVKIAEEILNNCMNTP